MKKMRLEFESLGVESFATAGHTGTPSGTVRGYYSADPFNAACGKVFPFTTNPGDTYKDYGTFAGTCGVAGCGLGPGQTADCSGSIFCPSASTCGQDAGCP